MMKNIYILGMLLISSSLLAQYPNNEEGLYQDILTPEYYHTPIGGVFREEVNKFVYFARLVPFQHPLENVSGEIPNYFVTRVFGYEIDTSQYHVAKDMRVGGDTLVNMYASFDGYVATYKDAPKYRDYLTITKNIADSSGNILGIMVAIYGHIDLILDESDDLLLDGVYVNKGDTVSKHLYSLTAGSPHIHFEIRYYRATDVGNEDYYGFYGNPSYTEPSSGSWLYGFWDPSIGYGFADPENHLNNSTTELTTIDDKFSFYPNPAKDIVTIQFENNVKGIEYSIYNIYGQLIEKKKTLNKTERISLNNMKSGMYIIEFSDNYTDEKSFIRIIKQ